MHQKGKMQLATRLCILSSILGIANGQLPSLPSVPSVPSVPLLPSVPSVPSVPLVPTAPPTSSLVDSGLDNEPFCKTAPINSTFNIPFANMTNPRPGWLLTVTHLYDLFDKECCVISVENGTVIVTSSPNCKMTPLFTILVNKLLQTFFLLRIEFYHVCPYWFNSSPAPCLIGIFRNGKYSIDEAKKNIDGTAAFLFPIQITKEPNVEAKPFMDALGYCKDHPQESVKMEPYHGPSLRSITKEPNVEAKPFMDALGYCKDHPQESVKMEPYHGVCWCTKEMDMTTYATICARLGGEISLYAWIFIAQRPCVELSQSQVEILASVGTPVGNSKMEPPKEIPITHFKLFKMVNPDNIPFVPPGF